MITLDKESGMTRSDYKKILDQALQAEHGIRLPYSNWAVAGFVRAQLYRFWGIPIQTRRNRYG